MQNLSFFIYPLAAFAYFSLIVLGLNRLKYHTSTLSFLLACGFSFLWSAYISYNLFTNHVVSLTSLLPFETLRNLFWFFYLLVLITCIHYENSYLFLLKSKYTQGLIFFVLIALVIEIMPFLNQLISTTVGLDIRVFFHVVFAIIGLILVEQLYRNSPSSQRWSIKFTCLGLGAIFVIDFVYYSRILLFANIDEMLWNIRGIINSLMLPLLAIALFRIKNTTKGIQFSRKLVFHSATLILTGIYLLLMSIAGFYIKHIGGNLGEMAQLVFLFLAVVILFILLFSGKLRALFKVFINKHFVHYRHDYREQWLSISKTLAEISSYEQLSPFIVKTLAELVDSTGGGLWIKNEQGDYYFSYDNNIGFKVNGKISKNSELVEFLIHYQWVIDLHEYENEPRVYNEIDLSYWVDFAKDIWLIIPLYQQKTLQGFVVLTRPQVARKLNWEDLDILKMVAMQLCNALVLSQASEKLSIAKQFEAYNRLSAFVVHDLKNVIAQIDLIVKNSEKYKLNPEFIDDTIDTLKNASKKMSNLVRQLKKAGDIEDKKGVDLLALLQRVIKLQSAYLPKPMLIVSNENTEKVIKECFILGEKEKLESILIHLIENAQDASNEKDEIKIILNNQAEKVEILIIDKGTGMDNKFIHERLFKPFDTTKGNAGMGIGVYEAREYIRSHAGSLDVISSLGQGTTFKISFPQLTFANNQY